MPEAMNEAASSGRARRRTRFMNLPYRVWRLDARGARRWVLHGRLEHVCGRYVVSRGPQELAEEFEAGPAEGSGPGDDPAGATADYNVAPTKQAPVVLGRGFGDRLLRLFTWGLVPSWAKDRSIGNRLVNARAETLLGKPAFQRAALSRRCLVPADGWYEWQVSPTETDARGKPRKQPFFMRSITAGTLAFAGLYELWRDPSALPDEPAAWLATYAIVTTAAEPGLDVVHDRMPFVLPADRWDGWLDPGQRDPDVVHALLQPPVDGRFEAVPVTNQVNSVRSNGPQLLEPVPWDQLHGVVDPRTGELLGTETPLF
jgi:putative SOS response-associated peptidase YedK